MFFAFKFVYILLLVYYFGDKLLSVQSSDVSSGWKSSEKGLTDLTGLLANTLKGEIAKIDLQEMILSGRQCQLCLRLADIYNRRKWIFQMMPSFLMRFLKSACVTLQLSQSLSLKECMGLIEVYSEPVFYILNKMKDVREICPILLQEYNCTEKLKPKWSINLDKNQPATRKMSSFTSGNPEIRILQLTDVHLSVNYTVPSNANCGEHLCCLDDTEPPKLLTDFAGFWSDYRNCDVPEHFLSETLSYTSKNLKFDYLYYTGDVVDHKIWATSPGYNVAAHEKFWNLMQQYFPEKGKVFPVLGNHEAHPCNLYPSSDDPNSGPYNIQWLYNAVADHWSHYLPECALETVRHGGYYTVSPEPGFRIIALNSNVAYYLNFWLWLDDVDPSGQLQWLNDVLAKAEIMGETVHILSHVPSGREMYNPWAEQLQNIIRRFSNIITGIFNGHTHYDEIVLYYDADGKSPVNVAFNGGSLTPYSNLNPNFKLFSVTPDTFDVFNYEVYTMDLEENNANPNGSVKWFKLYDFQSEYQLPDASAQSVHQLVSSLEQDPQQRKIYYRNWVRNAKPSMVNGCDETCEKQLVCNIVTTVPSNETLCSLSTQRMGF